MRQLAAAAAAAMPRSASVCDTLAFVQFKSGDFANAVAQERKAVQLDPASARWQIRLAHYLTAAGSPDEAAKLVDSIRAEPSFNLGALPEPLKREWEQLCASLDGRRASTQ